MKGMQRWTGWMIMLAMTGLLAGPEAVRAGNNLLKVRDAVYTTGQTVIINIDVTNEDAFKAFQFYITFPAGLAFDGSSLTLTSRSQDHNVYCTIQQDGSYYIFAVSFNKKLFLGNSGSVLELSCSAPGGVGSYPISISGARLIDINNSYLPLTTQGGQIVVFNPANAAKARILTRLEGWNDGSTMRTTLAAGSRIPLNSPYAQAPRTASSIPTNIADWILLELRTAPGGSAIFRQSYLLRNDGYLAELDGTTTSLTLMVPAGNYWIVLRHRNHAAVMSASAQSLTTSGAFFDFTGAASQYYSAGGTLVGIRYCMPAGDIDQDGHITSKDYVRWYKKKLAAPPAGYYEEDLNGDGLVTDADFALWQTDARLGLDSRLP